LLTTNKQTKIGKKNMVFMVVIVIIMEKKNKANEKELERKMPT
jgi:hypothetical protein